MLAHVLGGSVEGDLGLEKSPGGKFIESVCCGRMVRQVEVGVYGGLNLAHAPGQPIWAGAAVRNWRIRRGVLTACC